MDVSISKDALPAPDSDFLLLPFTIALALDAIGEIAASVPEVEGGETEEGPEWGSPLTVCEPEDTLWASSPLAKASVVGEEDEMASSSTEEAEEMDVR